MTLAQYLQALRKQWAVVLVLGLLGTAGGAAYALTVSPSYEAGVRMFVSSRTPQTSIADLSTGSDFTQQRVKSYADVVTSPKLLQPVIDALDLPYTSTELAERVTAASGEGTVILTLTVRDTVAARSARIADTIAARFPDFVADLEVPGDSAFTTPVRITVTQPAVVPEKPVSPNLPLDVAFGLILGLALGLTAAVARQQLNTTLQGAADVERLTGASPMGQLPVTKGAAKQPVLAPDETGMRAEAFRTLRTNLRFARIDTPAQVILVTSALPDEGKSTVAANLALTLATGGASVVLVDGDLRRPSVGTFFGVSDAAGLSSVLVGEHSLDEVLVPVQGGRMQALPSGPVPPNPAELLGTQHLQDLITKLRTRFEIVIVDAPPLLPVTDAAVLSACVDGVVLVGRNNRTRREEFSRALVALKAVDATILGTVLNFAPRPHRYRSGYSSYVGAPALAIPTQPTKPRDEALEPR